MSAHLKPGSTPGESYLDVRPQKPQFPGRAISKWHAEGKSLKEGSAESRLLQRILENKDASTSPIKDKTRKSSVKDERSSNSDGSLFQGKHPKPKRRRKSKLPPDYSILVPGPTDRGLTNDQLHVLPRPSSRSSHPPKKVEKPTVVEKTRSQEISSSSEKGLETESEGSNAELLPLRAESRHEEDGEVAETQLHLSRVRQRISELLDDAFAMAGGRKLYGSLRTKKIEPTAEQLPIFASFRKTRSQSAAARQYSLAQHEASAWRPLSEGGQRLVGAITDEGQLAVRPPPPKVVWAPSPELGQIEIDRPFPEAGVETRNRNVLYPLPHSRAMITPASSLPLLDTLHESASQIDLPFTIRSMLREACSEMYLAHSSRINHAAIDQYDEIDVISALREGEPVAALIQAIKEELQKFSSSLPGANDNESNA